MATDMKDVIIKGNRLYCYRCKKFFFSTKYLKSGHLPEQCNLCKRLDWHKKSLK